MPLSTFAAAYDSLPIGVAVLDRSLRVAAWNATLAKWSRVSAERAIGRTLPELFPGYPERRFGMRLDAVFSAGQSVVLSSAMHERVLPLETIDARPLCHKTYASPAAELPGHALLVMEDVTTTVRQLETLRAERKRLQDSERSLRAQGRQLQAKNAAIAAERRRAEAASRAKSEFLANMSHEIRTPLTAVKGFAEILVEQARDEFTREAATRVARNGAHLLALVNDLLDLSRIEAGRLTLRPEPCFPAEVARDVVSLVAARAAAKGITLAVRIDEGAPAVLCVDPIRLRQIVLNLVDNAIKFTDAGGVSVEVRGCFLSSGFPGVALSVADTGPGIPAEQADAVFAPFVQGDPSSQRRHGGVGLGLAIAYRLAREMGGSLRLLSEPGVGSTFTLTLPVGAVTPVELHEGDSDSGERPRLDGLRVLVAEDGPDNQALIDYLLTRAGAEVTIVGNGRFAVEAALSGESFDVILLDMQMPITDGYTAAAELRRRGVAAPIVALTAHAMSGDRERALAAGCDDYVAKPIDAPALIALLASLAPRRAEAAAPA